MMKKPLVYIIVIAIGYYVAARLGLMLAFPGTNATPIWAPTGISLAAVLLLGYRIWPGIALGALAVNFVLLGELNLSLPVSLAAALGTSVGNTLEALTGAFLIRRFTKSNNPFERTSGVVKFIILGAVISTTVSATIGVTALSLSAGTWKDFGPIWLTWWLGDAAGVILIVPLAMTYKKSVFFKRASWPEVWKNILLLASLFAVWHVVFSICHPVPFLLLPILIFSAFYQGQFGSAAMICILSGLSTFSTVNNMGPFRGYPLNDSLLLQQGFIGTVAIATMILASLVAERKKSAEISRESESYNRALFVQSSIGLALCRMDGSLVDVNPAYAALIGRTAAETLAFTYWDITPQDYEEREQAHLELLRTTGRYGPYEKEYVHKNGHRVPVRLQGQIIEWHGEKLIWSSVEDITEKKKAEEKLRESEKKFRFLYDFVPVMIFTLDIAGNVLSCNRFAVEELGYQPEELSGRPVLDIFFEEDRPALLKQFDEVQRNPGRAYEWELRKVHKRGHIVWVREIARAIQDQAGNVIILVACQDITDRKQAEEEIKTINEELIVINRIITAITGVSNIKEILEKVLDEALGITGLEGGTICMATPQNTLRLAVHRATSEATIRDLTTNEIKIGDCLCGECARDHKPLILPDREAVLKYATREATRGEDIRFHAAFPLIIGGKCLGVLCVFTRTDAKPGERRLKLLQTVTGQIALAVQNAGLFEEILRNAAILEEKVKERTAELETKVAEIERLNRLFAGRELRMKELKEKIKELEGRPGARSVQDEKSAEWEQ